MTRKATLTALALVLPLSFGAVAPALADQPNPYTHQAAAQNSRDHDRDWGSQQRHRILSPEMITRRLMRQDYSDIERLVYANGIYTARAEDRRGRDVALRVNAYSGEVLSVKFVEARVLPFRQVEYRLMSRGYRRIDQIGFNNGQYRVEARDRQNRLVRLLVDARTADVLRIRYVG